jgi:hypothetical protein
MCTEQKVNQLEPLTVQAEQPPYLQRRLLILDKVSVVSEKHGHHYHTHSASTSVIGDSEHQLQLDEK